MQRPSPSLTHIPWYPKDLLHELQTTLAALGDIDSRYEIEREHLEAQTESDTVRSQQAADLESRRWTEREPYVRRLTEIHHQMMAAMAYQDICDTA
jgi:hypothetical protein